MQSLLFPLGVDLLHQLFRLDTCDKLILGEISLERSEEVDFLPKLEQTRLHIFGNFLSETLLQDDLTFNLLFNLLNSSFSDALQILNVLLVYLVDILMAAGEAKGRSHLIELE